MWLHSACKVSCYMGNSESAMIIAGQSIKYENMNTYRAHNIVWKDVKLKKTDTMYDIELLYCYYTVKI